MATYVTTETIEIEDRNFRDDVTSSHFDHCTERRSTQHSASKEKQTSLSDKMRDDVTSPASSRDNDTASVITWSTDSDYESDHVMRKLQLAFGDYVTTNASSIKGVSAALFLIG